MTYLRITQNFRIRFSLKELTWQIGHSRTQKTRFQIFMCHRDPILAPPPRAPEIFLAPPGGKSIYRSVRRSESPRGAIETYRSWKSDRGGPKGSGVMGVWNSSGKTAMAPQRNFLDPKKFFFRMAPVGPQNAGGSVWGRNLSFRREAKKIFSIPTA